MFILIEESSRGGLLAELVKIEAEYDVKDYKFSVTPKTPYASKEYSALVRVNKKVPCERGDQFGPGM